ncbi:MAG: hypothetical protein Aurels2KO_25660 [Aureliella sp.]
MRLRSAEFDFGFYRVLFVGSIIRVFREVPVDGLEQTYELDNRWESKGPEQSDSVMGRKWKPRVTDAMEIVKRAREHTK